MSETWISMTVQSHVDASNLKSFVLTCSGDADEFLYTITVTQTRGIEHGDFNDLPGVFKSASMCLLASPSADRFNQLRNATPVGSQGQIGFNPTDTVGPNDYVLLDCNWPGAHVHFPSQVTRSDQLGGQKILESLERIETSQHAIRKDVHNIAEILVSKK